MSKIKGWDPIESLAKFFVKEALVYLKNPDSNEENLEVMESIICAIFITAGLYDFTLKIGCLTQRYYDKYGQHVGEYRFNNLSPFKVINEHGEADFFATGWLNNSFQLVRDAQHDENKKSELVPRLSAEIRQGFLIQPILLTSSGDILARKEKDCLTETYPFFLNTSLHFKNIHNHICLGIHTKCGGDIVRRPVSTRFDVLGCMKCPLRVIIPKMKRGYRELSFWLEKIS